MDWFLISRIAPELKGDKEVKFFVFLCCTKKNPKAHLESFQFLSGVIRVIFWEKYSVFVFTFRVTQGDE